MYLHALALGLNPKLASWVTAGAAVDDSMMLEVRQFAEAGDWMARATHLPPKIDPVDENVVSCPVRKGDCCAVSLL